MACGHRDRISFLVRAGVAAPFGSHWTHQLLPGRLVLDGHGDYTPQLCCLHRGLVWRRRHIPGYPGCAADSPRTVASIHHAVQDHVASALRALILGAGPTRYLGAHGACGVHLCLYRSRAHHEGCGPRGRPRDQFGGEQQLWQPPAGDADDHPVHHLGLDPPDLHPFGGRQAQSDLLLPCGAFDPAHHAHEPGHGGVGGELSDPGAARSGLRKQGQV
mmetsp:Transcript_32063/g.74900  ORF Transcript_32063/g.74900 Transcript_32063/m.74900 type:complete len:217 (+) Transcript_32063:650-1300(+)